MSRKNILHIVSNSKIKLRPSEQKVADYIITNAKKVTTMRIVDLASETGVSEPTVVRFCRTLGYSGFQKFKIDLAQQLAVAPIFSQFSIDKQDSVQTISEKIFDLTINGLLTLRNGLDSRVIAAAINALSKASRVEFYGYGTSAAIANDAKHKFFRLPFYCASYSDPHEQSMAASSLKAGDVIIAISQSGKTTNLIHSVTVAKRSGATVISVCPSSTPLTKIADICLEVDIIESMDMFSTMTSRIAQLTLIDVLTIGVAMRHGQSIEKTLEKIKVNQMPLYRDTL